MITRARTRSSADEEHAKQSTYEFHVPDGTFNSPIELPVSNEK